MTISIVVRIEATSTITTWEVAGKELNSASVLVTECHCAVIKDRTVAPHKAAVLKSYNESVSFECYKMEGITLF